jgi:hypothetical protein
MQLSAFEVLFFSCEIERRQTFLKSKVKKNSVFQTPILVNTPPSTYIRDEQKN